MKRKTGFFFDERCFWHSTGLHAVTLPVGGWVQPPAGGGHAESPETKRRMKNLMDVSGLTPQLALRSAAPASLEDLRRIHPDSYLERFKAISDNGGGMLGKEAPLGPGSYEIACLSAGLACAAVEAVLKGELDNAYSLSRPPGHHCLPDQSMGFCFLANIPIAVERAKAQLGLGKVAIIDWDVHHGNGTQHIYLQRDDVLTISLHQDGCFPPGYAGEDDRGVGAGEGYNINIPLLAGAGDDSWRYALGGTYYLDPQWTLRAGMALDKQASYNTISIPDTQRLWYSLGGSYQASEALSLDLGLAYLQGKDVTINEKLTPQTTAQYDVEASAFLASLQANYRF